MIDQVYKTLQTIVNKEHDGYVSPEEFNSLAKQVQDNIFRNYWEDFNRDKTKENKGMTNPGYGNLASNQSEKISQFTKQTTVSKVGSVYPLPSDLYFLEENGVVTSTGKVVDKAYNSNINYLTSSLSGPSEVFPVFNRVDNDLSIYPSTIAGDITVNYIRRPLDPKWTYTVVGGAELFNPSSPSYQDFELHPSEFPNIVNEMLSYFGINLREGEVVQIAEQLKNSLNVKDNA